MSKKMREPSETARKSYSPPSLSVYGGMASLTAAGTGAQAENTGQQTPDRQKP
jgi:hypothetical protein